MLIFCWPDKGLQQSDDILWIAHVIVVGDAPQYYRKPLRFPEGSIVVLFGFRTAIVR